KNGGPHPRNHSDSKEKTREKKHRKHDRTLRPKVRSFFYPFFMLIFLSQQNPLETNRTLWYKARRYFAV
uniref:hypothetical protein n=1 Tax=Aggregatibacter kilianii TaxID=2025884 RepID=UPI0028EA360E